MFDVQSRFNFKSNLILFSKSLWITTGFISIYVALDYRFNVRFDRPRRCILYNMSSMMRVIYTRVTVYLLSTRPYECTYNVAYSVQSLCKLLPIPVR